MDISTLMKYGFLDQPHGHCLMCKWNLSTTEQLSCACPRTHLVNPICIGKLNVQLNANIDYDLRDQMEDGEDWKHDADEDA